MAFVLRMQAAPTILATFVVRSSCLALFRRPLQVQSVHAAVDLDTYDQVRMPRGPLAIITTIDISSCTVTDIQRSSHKVARDLSFCQSGHHVRH